MTDKYILQGRKPVLANSFAEWGRFFGKPANRRVEETQIGNVRISTVFLGIDHNFSGAGPPVLFETMVFGGPLGGEQRRYCTWTEAKRGHKRMIGRVHNRADDKEGNL